MNHKNLLMKLKNLFLLTPALITIIGFEFTPHNAQAMLPADLEDLKVKKTIQVTLSEHEIRKPFAVSVSSKNLFMRNPTMDSGDLDYYFHLFFNKIAMEKYMHGIPRPATEIIDRHKKYLGGWQTGNPFSSYLTFLNEGAAESFLSEQERLLPAFFTHLNFFSAEEMPLKHELQNGLRILLNSLKKEFEISKKIFIGHVLLEPGTERNLATDAEVSYVFLPPFWGKGYGTEAVENIVEVVKIFRQKNISLDSQIVDALIATALPSNPSSCKVLENNGFQVSREEKKFGDLRRLYLLELK